MRLIRVPLTVGSYSSGVVELTWRPEDHARVAMIGLSVDKRAALYDHELRQIDRGGRVHVTKGQNVAQDANFYPHLGAAACFVDYLAPASFAAVDVLVDSVTGDVADGTLEDVDDPADAPASADALREDLVANALPQIRNNLKDLVANINLVNLKLVAEAGNRVTNTELADLARRGFQPWPGRLNDPADWQRLLFKLAERQQLTAHEVLRLKLARSVPCERFAMIALKPGEELKITAARIHGSTSIAYAYAWCIEFDDAADLDLLCQVPDLTDVPHWLCSGLELSAAAATQTDVERRWLAEQLGSHALRIISPFVVVHSNNAGTKAYAPDYMQNILLQLKSGGGADVYPTYGAKLVRLAEQVPHMLQHFDCWRRFDYILRYLESLVIQTKTLATMSYQHDVRLTFYGLLRPQDKSGNVLDKA